MGPRATIVAGLASGTVVAVVLLVGVVLLLPDPGTAAVSSTEPSASSPPSSASVGPSVASPSPTNSAGPALFHVGERAPALSVPQLGGGQVNLANLAGKPVWIAFLKTTCPLCVAEWPTIGGFATRYASSGLVVIGVDVSEDEGTVASLVKTLKTQFPTGLDVDGAAARAWGATSLPTHFWVDSGGVIRAGAQGIGPDVMARNLGLILPGVQVTP